MGDQQQARQASSMAGTKEGSSTAQHGEVNFIRLSMLFDYHHFMSLST
jgi:hypothetical protein